MAEELGKKMTEPGQVQLNKSAYHRNTIYKEKIKFSRFIKNKKVI